MNNNNMSARGGSASGGKKIIIGLIVLAALAGGVFLLAGKSPLRQGFGGASKETLKNSGTKIEDKIYVAVEEAGEIAVVSVKNRNVIKRINLSLEISGMKIGFMPHNVQVAPDNKTVWVTANAMDMSKAKISFFKISRVQADEGHGEEGDLMEFKTNDEIIIINPLTDEVIKRIQIGDNQHLSHVALTPDSNYAIAAAQTKGVIYKINAKTYEVEKEAITEKGGEPHGLRISPDGKTAYIAMLKGRSLGILDIEKMSLSYIPLKGAAVQAGVTPNGKYAMASVYDAKSLAVYEITSQKLSYVDLPREAKGPVQIYPSPDSRFVYVADQGYYFNQPNSDLVYKIDLQEMKVAETIKGGTAPHGVAVSQDGKFVYVTNLLSDDLSVIDAGAGKEVAKIKIGKMPNGVSLFYGEGLVSPITEKEKGFLTAEETAFDFGSIPMYGGKVKHNFKIKNTSSGIVEIINIYTSCMCTESFIVGEKSRIGPFGMPGHDIPSSGIKETLNPGEERIIEVGVDPAAHGPQGTGPAKKIVYIESVKLEPGQETSVGVLTPLAEKESFFKANPPQKLQLMLDINVTR